MIEGWNGEQEEERGGGRVLADAFEVPELWECGEGEREVGR